MFHVENASILAPHLPSNRHESRIIHPSLATHSASSDPGLVPRLSWTGVDASLGVCSPLYIRITAPHSFLTTTTIMPSHYYPVSPPLSSGHGSPYLDSTLYTRAPLMPTVPLPPCPDHYHPQPSSHHRMYLMSPRAAPRYTHHLHF